MARTFYFDANGHRFEFVCDSRKTRNGFAHDVLCFIDDYDNNSPDYIRETCTYYNRTWERYEYQTVMQKLTHAQASKHVEWIREDYMREHGYKRMTAKRKTEFAEYLDRECDDPSLRTWCTLYQMIENRDIMDPPYPDWYGHRPRTFSPSYFA